MVYIKKIGVIDHHIGKDIFWWLLAVLNFIIFSLLTLAFLGLDSVLVNLFNAISSVILNLRN